MDLSIRVPDEDVTALNAKAAAHGVSAEEYVLRLLRADLAPEWLRRSWESARQTGLDRMSDGEIEAEIAEARMSRRTA